MSQTDFTDAGMMLTDEQVGQRKRERETDRQTVEDYARRWIKRRRKDLATVLDCSADLEEIKSHVIHRCGWRDTFERAAFIGVVLTELAGRRTS